MEGQMNGRSNESEGQMNGRSNVRRSNEWKVK